MQYEYINNTCEDITEFHSIILKAIENNAKFEDDFSDIFVLRKAPEGSASKYSLEFA